MHKLSRAEGRRGGVTVSLKGGRGTQDFLYTVHWNSLARFGVSYYATKSQRKEGILLEATHILLLYTEEYTF